MIISHRHRFIFIKTRKTAGTSVEIALARHCGPDDVVTEIIDKALTAGEVSDYPGARNYAIPAARLSVKNWLAIPIRGWPDLNNHDPAERIRKFVGAGIWNSYFKFTFERNPWDRFLSQFHWNSRFHQWSSMAEYYDQTEVYRKTNWPLYTIDDRPSVDFVGHFETLQADVELVRQRLGLAELDLPLTKAIRKDRKHYTDEYAPQMRDRVAEACAREIDLFGYRFETPEPIRFVR